LICFAVDIAGAQQVRWNHLSGVATVVTFADADASQAKQGFKYNAWAFTARSATAIPPADGTAVGTAGNLVLSGANDNGVYDACPQYLIGNFSPSGASLGGVRYLDNDLNVSICKQDLRQDFTPHFTKIRFEVWNEQEVKFTGSYQCVDSVSSFGLDPSDAAGLVAPENFTFNTLRTTNAMFHATGIASTQCAGSENTGIVAVLTTSIGIGDATEDAELGNTIHGAGVAVNSSTGFVLWDPQSAIVPTGPKR
jgi:hypothetical protein